MDIKIKSCELVTASEEEEFFYSDSELPVQDGDPVGVDLGVDNEVKFILFDGICWKGNED